jgi:hypothetical protein
MAKEKISFIKTNVTNKQREVISPYKLRYTRISVRICCVPHSACGAPLFPVVFVCFCHERQWHTREHFLNVILPETRHFDIHSAVRVKGTPLWTVLSRPIEILQKAQHAK